MPRIIIDYDTDTIGDDTSTTDVIEALERLLPYVFNNVMVRDNGFTPEVDAAVSELHKLHSWFVQRYVDGIITDKLHDDATDALTDAIKLLEER